jgi:peptidoglycan/LPS O-acetylase OafA/YrhL
MFPSLFPQPRLRGLDGLRAIAVCAVLLFHADVPWARGGYLGVDLFFVISGFLITGLLADQCQREGSGGLLLPFYWRRAKRLLPAAWVMIAAVVITAALFAADALPRLRGDALASLFYVTNWELIAHQTSYFESTGRPPLLMHLWSLAIEEQFYLVWAPLLLWGLPRLGRARMAAVTLALALASAVWMGVMTAKIGYPAEQNDPSRLYFGADTRGFAMLFGAALGLLWRPRRVDGMADAGRAAKPLGVGLAALAATLALFALLGEQSTWLYPWGFLAITLASVVLIAAATHTGSAFGLWLDNRVMRWIGERSYGIYLWHWPVFMLTRPDIDLPALPPAVVACGRIALVIGIAALSYAWVETPIRQGLLERTWRTSRTPGRGFAWPRGLALAASGLLTFGAIATVLLRAPAHSTPAADVLAVFEAEEPEIPVALEPPAAPEEPSVPIDALVTISTETPETPTQARRADPPDSPDPAPAPLDLALDSSPGAPPAIAYTGKDLTALGDSVLLGSSRLLEATLKGADIHATVGWQAVHVLKQVRALDGARQLRPVVLVHLGNNGYVTETQLRQILSLLTKAKRVLLVNNHVPRRWMEANDALFKRVAVDYPNVALIDWRKISDGNPKFFASDDVHLTPQGQRAFVQAILSAGLLAPTPPAKAKDKLPRFAQLCASPASDPCAEWRDDVRLPPAPFTLGDISAMKLLSYAPSALRY